MINKIFNTQLKIADALYYQGTHKKLTKITISDLTSLGVKGADAVPGMHALLVSMYQ